MRSLSCSWVVTWFIVFITDQKAGLTTVGALGRQAGVWVNFICKIEGITMGRVWKDMEISPSSKSLWCVSALHILTWPVQILNTRYFTYFMSQCCCMELLPWDMSALGAGVSPSSAGVEFLERTCHGDTCWQSLVSFGGPFSAKQGCVDLCEASQCCWDE